MAELIPYNHIFTFLILLGFVIEVFNAGASAAALGIGDASGERPICLYHISDKVKSDNVSGGDQLLDENTVKCDGPDDYCFSYWEINSVNDTQGKEELIATDGPGFTWLASGCFKNTHNCYQESCIATDRELDNAFFCCCKGNRCNEKIGFLEATRTTIIAPSDSNEGRVPADPLSDALYIILSFLIVILVISIAAMCCQVRRKRNSLSNTSLGLNKVPTSPCIDLNNLTFMEMLGHGRYGTAYKALLRDEEVAVKLFSHHHRVSFTNEKYIYSLPLMEHPNLLSCFGGGEIIGPDKNPYLGLVLSYCSQGRLSTYLQENTLDWAGFCKIVISAVRGLGHLHSDVRKGDLMKPCVVHRDFNTRNILIKEDMSCAVSDLGFAIHTQGAKFYINGVEQIAEMASLTDVGTLRYMAPEVLEGAVNLRDCETSLKQIDIYALGLVLWEVAYRCHDLYQGTPTPNYALPFEAEIGLRPSFEQMQVLVARNKARPLIPQIWKDSSPAVKQLKETIEDCWDNDAEARLSAMCVERRLLDLPKMWTRYKASLGMNPISPTGNPPPGNFINGPDVKSFLISNELSLPKDRDNHSQRETSVSENTVETNLPFSPSDPNGRILGKNQLLEAVNVAPFPPLQPHQGRNPCLERNTINEHSKELHISGNDLVDSSEKYPYSNLQLELNSASLLEALESRHGIDPQLMSEHLVPLLNRFLPPSPQAAPTNPGAIPHPQAMPFPSPQVPPIPYVQNEMRAVEGRPKLHNASREVERRGGWKRFLRTAWEDRLGALLPRRRQRRQVEEEERGRLVTPTSSTFSEPPTPVSPFPPVHNGLRQAEVLLSNGSPYTVINYNEAPSSFTPQNVPVPQIHQSEQQAPPTTQPRVSETEIGIAKLQMQPRLTPIVRSRPGSKDSGINKSSENSNSFLDSDSSLDRARRPTTLLLQGRNLSSVITSDEDFGSDGERISNLSQNVKLRKAKQRIKTPRCPTLPRFSLYDDSMMGGGKTQTTLEQTLSRSLPLNMNDVGSGSNRASVQPNSERSSGSSLSRKTGSLSLRQSESSSGSGGESVSNQSPYRNLKKVEKGGVIFNSSVLTELRNV